MFEYLEPKYNIACKLELFFEDDALIFHDENFHCARYVFSCGARVGLDGVMLPKASEDLCQIEGVLY